MQIYVVELLIILRVRSIRRPVIYRGDEFKVKVFQKRFVIQNFAFLAVFCRVYDFVRHAVLDFPNADIFRRDVFLRQSKTLGNSQSGATKENEEIRIIFRKGFDHNVLLEKFVAPEFLLLHFWAKNKRTRIFGDFLQSHRVRKNAVQDIVYGQIAVSWRKEGDIVELNVKIPDGITVIFGSLLDCGKDVSYKNLKMPVVKRAVTPLKLVSGEWLINFLINKNVRNVL